MSFLPYVNPKSCFRRSYSRSASFEGGGGGVTDTHATTTNYPCTTTESLLEHELDNQQLNQWAFRMSQKFNTVSTAFALSRGLHPKGSHNFELVRKILLIKEKDLNNVVLKLQKKKKRRRTLR